METLPLKECYQRGLSVFLFFDELNASRDDGEPLTENDRGFLRENRDFLIFEIKDQTYGPRVSFDLFLEDR